MRVLFLCAFCLFLASRACATDEEEIEVELQLAFRPQNPEPTQTPSNQDIDQSPVYFPQAIVVSIIGCLIAGSFIGGAGCWYVRKKRTVRRDASATTNAV